MSRLRSRVRRLHNSTHTWVTLDEWHLIAADWKRHLDNAGRKPEDFECEVAEFKKKLHSIDIVRNDSLFRQTLLEFVERNRMGYYAYMYWNTTDLISRRPKGCWMMTSYTGFFVRLRELKADSKRAKED